MAKDPAILLYIDKWIAATQGMSGDCKGWFLDLILYQFDKGSLPNDLDELASIARIRPSEFEKFKQVFEQVFKHKFKQNEEGRLENEFAKEILKGREVFKEKRSNAGKLSYVLKYFRKNFNVSYPLEKFIKEKIVIDFDIKNEQVLKQVFKQISELYINGNVNVNESKNDKGGAGGEILITFENTELESVWLNYCSMRKNMNCEIGEITKPEILKQLEMLSNKTDTNRIAILSQSIRNNWKDLYQIKENSNGKSELPRRITSAGSDFSKD